MPRGCKTRVAAPGGGPPFLNEEEWRRKFRCEPPVIDEEVLTREYDKKGRIFKKGYRCVEAVNRS